MISGYRGREAVVDVSNHMKVESELFPMSLLFSKCVMLLALLGCSVFNTFCVMESASSEPEILPTKATAPALQQSLPEVEQQEVADESGEPEIPREIDALLDRLEVRSAELRGFVAKITYEKYDDLLGRREIRSGEILYRVNLENTNKTFAILFDKLIINRRRSSHLQHFIFDGRWLAEIDHETTPKQFIKREMVAPGDTFDPLKLGEGPIPLPIGQSKKDVLARFNVSKASLPEEGFLAGLDPESVNALRLVPRERTPEAKEFSRIDIFYDRETDLPVGILALELNQNRKTVLLREVKRDPEFTPEMLGKLDITVPDPGQWQVEIQPWIPRP